MRESRRVAKDLARKAFKSTKPATRHAAAKEQGAFARFVLCILLF